MANPQPTDAHLRIAHSISEAIMMRDFSKRQRKILDLILRLSWGCNKKFAHIPYQRDFQVTGIYEGDIKKELEWLEVSKIVCREDNYYWFNKDFDEWQISRVHPFDPKRLSELLSDNIKEKLDNEILSSHPKLSEMLSHENEKLSETLTVDLVKHELLTSYNTKFATSDLALPKESIKENIKENTTTTAEEGELSQMCRIYEQNIGVLSPMAVDKLRDMAGQYPPQWFAAAVEEAVNNNARKLSYIERILERWHTDGFRAPRKGGNGDKPVQRRTQPRLRPLTYIRSGDESGEQPPED